MRKALNETRGHIHKLYYKNGSYKIVSFGTSSSVTLYLRGDSVTHTYSKGIDTLFVNNILRENKPLDTLYFTGNKQKILDHVTLQSIKKIGQTTYTYYTDSTMYLNPENFSSYKFAYQNQFYQSTKSLPLKEEYESLIFKIKSIAIDISHENLQDSIFKVPDFPKKRVTRR